MSQDHGPEATAVRTDAPPDPTTQWRLISAVLGGLLLVALITLIVLVSSSEDDAAQGSGAATAQRLLDAEKDADAAARIAAVSLTTYDWATLEEDFSWVESGGTRKFQDQYAEVSAPIRELVAKIKAHAEGTVVDSAATAEDPDHVTVLLFLDQTLTNQGNEERKLDQPRLSLLMVREDGRWLVDEVKVNNLTDS